MEDSTESVTEMADNARGPSTWTRREWTTTNALMLAGIAGGNRLVRNVPGSCSSHARANPATHDLAPAGVWEGIVQQAVEAAMAAGASYADARITRDVQQLYSFMGNRGNYFSGDLELNGLGVRVLVDGTWGFAASPRISRDNATQLAKTAVAQAKGNALGAVQPVSLGKPSTARGTWVTPMRIDPFTVPIEEKNDTIGGWLAFAIRCGTPINTMFSRIHFARQERVVATSDGALCSQRLYETGGNIVFTEPTSGGMVSVSLDGLKTCGRGWELFEDAKIWDQTLQVRERMRAQLELKAQTRPVLVGRYTIVCDGATMAALTDATLGTATQLDRALGYEANASGTSFLDDPLNMLGSFQTTSPLVTLTGNRSVPTQLGTVAWDDEGVVPKETQFITDGVLTDFQTTREQAEWLAPYYAKANRPTGSHGCAAAERALKVTMQHAPNLAIAPSHSDIPLDRLVSDIPNGILITEGFIQTDMQARNGVLAGAMRQIKNGRIGRGMSGGAILFNTLDFWKKLQTIGDASTVGSVAVSQYPHGTIFPISLDRTKGQPPQVTSRTITAPAATIINQAVVDVTRKA